jgi:multiple sugar transport system substrate-binding protein
MEDEVPTGAGQWKVAPMPQWRAGQKVYGQYGGSTTAVFAATKHPKAAETFAIWMNTNKAAIQAGVVAGFGWPAATTGLSVSALHTSLSYFEKQNIFPIFNTAETRTRSGWNFGPDYSTVLTQMGDLFSHLGGRGKMSLAQILSKTQVEQYTTLKADGITVIK